MPALEPVHGPYMPGLGLEPVLGLGPELVQDAYTWFASAERIEVAELEPGHGRDSCS